MTKSQDTGWINEKQLLERIREGDHDAFKIVFDRYRVLVYRYCSLMLKDRNFVDDVYQDVFFRFYKQCREDREIHNVKGYLLAISRTRCLDHIEQKKRFVDLEEAPEVSYEVDTDLKDVENYLHKALARIPDQYREAFVLFALKEYTYAEIASMLNVSLNVVRNRIYRAKQGLQKILGPVLRKNDDGL